MFGRVWRRPSSRAGAVLLAVGLVSVIGATVAHLLTPTLYRAVIAVEIKPNLGGLRINSSTDASAQSVQWMQRPLLETIREGLTGPALGDPSALFRIRCVPENADRDVVCSTTSASAQAARGVLNQMVTQLIPIESALLKQSDQLGIGEREEEIVQLGQKDGALRATIGAMRDKRLTSDQLGQLRLDRASLRVDGQTKPAIIAVIASIRRQITHTLGSFQVLDGGAKVNPIAQRPWWLMGGAIGLALAVSALAVLASSRRSRLVSRSTAGSRDVAYS